MNLSLQNKKALVCGSSQGIGRACAIELATLGCSITLFARNAQTLESVLSELDYSKGQAHQFIVANFTSVDEVSKVINEHIDAGNCYDILINNTGGPAPGPAHSAEKEDYVEAFQQHLLNNQTLVQALLPSMKEKQTGRIVNVISTSVKQPIVGLGVSNTIRGAVASWSKTLATELGPFGITVNNVLPGATATARLDAIFENKAKKQNKTIEQVIEEEKNAIPLRRFAQPEEFAAAVAFLCSDSAGYITGINLPIDGGRTQCL